MVISTGWAASAPTATTPTRVFKLTPAGVLTTLHSFDGSAEGRSPNGALVEGLDGSFYGTTYLYAAQGIYGTIYRVTPAGDTTVLHRFQDGSGGVYPKGLALGRDGNLYGTTQYGGDQGGGVIYRITPGGDFTILHSFAGGIDVEGGAALIAGSDGNFYGTTQYGGANNRGTVFQMTPLGGFTTLYSFSALGCERQFTPTTMVPGHRRPWSKPARGSSWARPPSVERTTPARFSG